MLLHTGHTHMRQLQVGGWGRRGGLNNIFEPRSNGYSKFRHPEKYITWYEYTNLGDRKIREISFQITHKYVLKYTDDYRVAYRFILFTRRNICSYHCHSYKVILTTMIVHPTSLLLLKDIKTRRISEECTVLHASLK